MAKNQAKAKQHPCLNFCYFKKKKKQQQKTNKKNKQKKKTRFIHFLHRRYHPKIIKDILKNVQKTNASV